MHRNTFRIGALAALLLVSALATSIPSIAAPPNIVVMIADDVAWNDIGPHGNTAVRTPNLDRLAKEGMRFDRAILTTSSCSPSRCSILTGRYPHSTAAPELHQPLPAEQLMLTEPLRKAGYFTGQAGKWHLGNPAKAKFDKVMDGKGGASGCEQWLPLLRERPKDKPFFLWLAAVDAHRGYQAGAIPQPHDPKDVIVPPFLPDVPAVRKDLGMYYDEITRLDGHVGQVLDELATQGVADNTLVIFMSDNGRPFPRCKTTLTDDGIRSPFLARMPGKTPAGSTTGALISAVDLAPTFLELAGLPLPESFQGQSFAKVLSDPQAKGRDYAFAEHNWHDYRAFERAVRSPRYTYIRNWLPEQTQSPPADAVNSPTFAAMKELRDAGKLPPEQAGVFKKPRAEEELYDVEKDPFSLNNLAADPAHAEALAAHRKALEEWQAKTEDKFDKESLTPDRYDRETGKRLGQ